MENIFNKDEFLKLHWQAKQPIREIAKSWNVSPYEVYKWTHNREIPIRRGRYTFSKKLLHKWYWEDELTFQQIANNLGVNRNCVSQILAKVGIHKRSKSERMKLAWRRGDITVERLMGEKNHLWKGGRTISSNGYILIHKPSHPRASKNGYVYEHILILEQKLGHPLPEGWIGHHLNGIKSDNRPVNLVALPNKEHSNILKEKAKRIQELEAILASQ